MTLYFDHFPDFSKSAFVAVGPAIQLPSGVYKIEVKEDEDEATQA